MKARGQGPELYSHHMGNKCDRSRAHRTDLSGRSQFKTCMPTCIIRDFTVVIHYVEEILVKILF